MKRKNSIFTGLGILLTAASSAFLAAAPSHAIAFNPAGTQILPSQFSQFQGLVDTNAGNNPGTNDLIDRANFTGGLGFGNGTTGFFGSNFLLLGANGTNANIPTDSLRNNNSAAVSVPIQFSPSDINAASPILITFNWAFNGTSTGGFNDADNFTFGLYDNNGVNPGLVPILQRNAPAGYGRVNAAAVYLDLAGGGIAPNVDYNLVITLNENVNNNSSAAGFNNILLQVPFEFSPATGLLGVGALFVGSAAFKRFKMKKAAK